MSDLVERTCQVRVHGDTVFYYWRDDDFIVESPDPDMKWFDEGYRLSKICGKPAFDSVDFGDEVVWMCAYHLARHENGVIAEAGFGDDFPQSEGVGNDEGTKS